MHIGVGTNSVDKLISRLRLFMTAETGVSFKPLAAFSQPLFELYELDAGAFAEKAPAISDADELARGLSALEAGRLFWAYLSLDEADAVQAWPALVHRIVGHTPSDEERQQLTILVAEMRSRWEAFGEKNRVKAESEHGIRTLAFDEVLDHFKKEAADVVTEELAGVERFGPEELALPDAMAVFARPLLETREVLADADAFENAMSRAGEYWELAQTPSSEFGPTLKRIVSVYARSPLDAERIEDEAERMVARFFQLFPEKKKMHTS